MVRQMSDTARDAFSVENLDQQQFPRVLSGMQ